MNTFMTRRIVAETTDETQVFDETQIVEDDE